MTEWMLAIILVIAIVVVVFTSLEGNTGYDQSLII